MTPSKRLLPFAAIREKRAAVAGGSSDNREASNRVDRSHSMSTEWTSTVMNEKA
jgi:hypothetical protein